MVRPANAQAMEDTVDRFKALLITRDEATKAQSVAPAELGESDLMPGDVDVRVDYSTINYKDGLAITGKLPVVRRFPMIPGIDFAGTVTASAHDGIRPGDKVVLNGWGVGETHLGAYSQMARVKGDWLIPLPAGMTGAEAMAIGTAGYTAMLALLALERAGLTPERGPVVVTGAAGGVGSVAVALLAKKGFTVEAVTGRASEADYLKGLGAATIVPREELTGPAKLLGKERWAGGIDSVGSHVLANVLSMTMAEGAIAACGNAAGMDLPTSVAPFILRGVSLVGIDSVYQPKPRRIEAWSRLETDLDRDKLARGDDISSSASHVGLVRKTEQFPDVVQRKAEFTGAVDKGEPLLLRRSTIMVTRKPPLSSGRNPGIREDGQDRSRQVPRAGRGRSGGRAPARHCRDEFHAAGQEDAVGGWHRCAVQHGPIGRFLRRTTLRKNEA